MPTEVIEILKRNMYEWEQYNKMMMKMTNSTVGYILYSSPAAAGLLLQRLGRRTLQNFALITNYLLENEVRWYEQNNNNLKMFNLYFHSATSATKVFPESHRRRLHSEVYKRRRYCAEYCEEIGLYGRDEAVTQRWRDTLLIWTGRR